MPEVHITAIIGKHTRIGPYSILEDGVEIGEHCIIESCVKIYTGVRMGDNNQLLHGAVIGAPPQSGFWHQHQERSGHWRKQYFPGAFNGSPLHV